MDIYLDWISKYWHKINDPYSNIVLFLVSVQMWHIKKSVWGFSRTILSLHFGWNLSQHKWHKFGIIILIAVTNMIQSCNSRISQCANSDKCSQPFEEQQTYFLKSGSVLPMKGIHIIIARHTKTISLMCTDANTYKCLPRVGQKCRIYS